MGVVMYLSAFMVGYKVVMPYMMLALSSVLWFYHRSTSQPCARVCL